MPRFLIITFLVSFYTSYAQTGNSKAANDFFANENFSAAQKEYDKLLETEPENEKYLYRLSVCYLNINADKTKAIPYLEKLVKNEKADPNSWYLLGRAYHYAHRFDEAIKMFETFKQKSKGTSYNIKDVEKQIEYCYNAKELVKYPLDITFENMGENINSKYPDYFPFVPADQSYLAFTSRRDDGSGKEKNGQYKAEVYISREKNGTFSRAKSIGAPISKLDGNEEIIGMSADGRIMLFLFENEEDGFGDIFIGQYDGKAVSKLTKMGKEVNSKYTEIAASMNATGDAIYFASDRPGGYGGIDLYVTRKLPNGAWSEPQNLGPSVNTSEDEDFPNISADEKTLYFSSKGHTSMGGYDIFKVQWDGQKRQWSNVQNLGYPINTAEDNTNLRMSETGRYGYMSAYRNDSYGDLDIYKITFNEVPQQFTIIKGVINDSEANIISKNVSISVSDNRSLELAGEYLPNPNTGRFIIILPVGTYNLLVEADGYKTHSEDIEIFDNNAYVPEMVKNIRLD